MTIRIDGKDQTVYVRAKAADGTWAWIPEFEFDELNSAKLNEREA